MIHEGKAVLAAAVELFCSGRPFRMKVHTQAAPLRALRNRWRGFQCRTLAYFGTLQGVRFLAVGRVDAVSSESAQVVVLGQAYRLDAAASLNWLRQPVSVGTHIALFGERTEDGNFADATLTLTATYVPGASPVFLSGFVSKLTPSLGLVEIAGQVISLVGASNETSREWIHVGDYLEVVGTQPLPSSVARKNLKTEAQLFLEEAAKM